MRAIPVLAAVAGILAFALPAAAAPTINLFTYGFKIDDDDAVFDSAPAGVNIAGFDTDTGLGTVTVTLSGAGSHYVSMFVDHDIVEFPNNLNDNEYGVVNGAPAAGQTWQIGDALGGTIMQNFETSALDNTNAVPEGSKGDVAMALAWSFELTAGQTAAVTFLLSQVEPLGFSLAQFDGGPVTFSVLPAADVVYFGSTLDVRGAPVVPIPPAVVLFGSGLAALFAAKRRRSAAA